ncbi:hypothetical protein ZWY2020_002937 [Hordeum vulgare]|nr:hypothetical protein ZWY2020_002937 [Hordeum vulgare]
MARRQARAATRYPIDPRHYLATSSAAADAFKRRFGNVCYRCLGSRHKFFECRDPITCYTYKRLGHLERGYPEHFKSKGVPVPPQPVALPPAPPSLAAPTAAPLGVGPSAGVVRATPVPPLPMM